MGCPFARILLTVFSADRAVDEAAAAAKRAANRRHAEGIPLFAALDKRAAGRAAGHGALNLAAVASGAHAVCSAVSCCQARATMAAWSFGQPSHYGKSAQESDE